MRTLPLYFRFAGVDQYYRDLLSSFVIGIKRMETSQAPDDKAEAAAIGRFSLDKQFHGDLVGTSKDEMPAVSTAVSGSAGYVAMEQFTGTLYGRTGTFALQHTGTMTRGTPELSVTVVPDSGTGELIGLSGKMESKLRLANIFTSLTMCLLRRPEIASPLNRTDRSKV